MEGRELRRRAGALAAIAGGAAWTIKAAAILLTGVQPPVLFEVGGPLFLVAVAGIHASVAPRTKGARVGFAGLAGSGLCSLLAIALAIVRPSWRPVDESLTPVGALLLAAALLLLVSLGALGRRVQVERAFPGGARHLPLGLAIGALPALAIGAALADAGGERLLEVPLLGIAVCWMAVGAAMLRVRRS